VGLEKKGRSIRRDKQFLGKSGQQYRNGNVYYRPVTTRVGKVGVAGKKREQAKTPGRERKSARAGDGVEVLETGASDISMLKNAGRHSAALKRQGKKKMKQGVPGESEISGLLAERLGEGGGKNLPGQAVPKESTKKKG